MRARHLLIGLLKLYQTAVSPYIGNCCRFHPSCSEYMIGSIRLNGTILGVLDGIRRIPSSTPRIVPFRRIDPIMYSEQLGWNLQQLPM